MVVKDAPANRSVYCLVCNKQRATFTPDLHCAEHYLCDTLLRSVWYSLYITSIDYHLLYQIYVEMSLVPEAVIITHRSLVKHVAE